ncbi:hypothetical protein [Roseivirga sp. E12]|uniref:hypothetical protein n=1 Tax=Roseivirga sp. E12 TaxID=2819237 RepID=UPI001ABC6C69|nr:hypothetical protein [Roseivirga sp. E12]MBO3700739.1 hypothetical protein [Roseivirga sp. E12]
MKKIALTLLTLCLVTLASSQTNTFPTTGNAGIGTISPFSKLSFGTSNSNFNSRIAFYEHTNDGSRFRGIGMANPASGIYGVGIWAGGGTYIPNDTNAKMFIQDNGNIGMGTVSPLSRLHISPSSSGGTPYDNNGITVENTTRSVLQMLTGNTGDQYLFFGDSDKANRAWVGFNHNIDQMNFTFHNSPGNFAFVNGNVGIGTTSPTEKLEIFNSVTTPGVVSLMSIRNDASYVDVGRISAKQSTVEVARIGLPRAGGTNTGFLTFWTKAHNSLNLTEKMRLDESGNLGIGTTSPTEKLSVNGNILAKKVRVSVAAADWPDYVFASTYKLRPLNELEDYIKKNEHLPEVPSAQEVETDGLDLGDMDATLLKKVEELTLYLIEQDKTFKTQAASLEEVKEENLELRKMLVDMRKEIELLKKDK